MPSARGDVSDAAVTKRLNHSPQERRIKELEESLTKCRRVQEQVKGQTHNASSTLLCLKSVSFLSDSLLHVRPKQSLTSAPDFWGFLLNLVKLSPIAVRPQRRRGKTTTPTSQTIPRFLRPWRWTGSRRCRRGRQEGASAR